MSPGQPIQAPLLARITGSSAETRPPGERRQLTSPVVVHHPVDGQAVGDDDEVGGAALPRASTHALRPYPRYVDADPGQDGVHLPHHRDRLRGRHQLAGQARPRAGSGAPRGSRCRSPGRPPVRRARSTRWPPRARRTTSSGSARVVERRAAGRSSPISVATVAVTAATQEVIDAVRAAVAPAGVEPGDRRRPGRRRCRTGSPPPQPLGLAEHEVGQRERVDAHVEQGAGPRARGRAAGPSGRRPAPHHEPEVGVDLPGGPVAPRWRAGAAASGSSGGRPSTWPPSGTAHGRPPRRTGLSSMAASSVIGFSQSTALPASSASRTCSSCRACGVATYTTSTSGSATSAS